MTPRCRACKRGDCSDCAVIQMDIGSCQCSCNGGPVLDGNGRHDEEADMDAKDYDDAQEGLLPNHAFRAEAGPDAGVSRREVP